MLETKIDTLGEVFCQTLESLAFMFGSIADREELPGEVDACMEVTIHYSGESCGTLTLLTAKDLAEALVENLTDAGGASADADTLAQDALGELMNVTLGQFLTEVSGVEPVYDLSPPEVKRCEPQRWSAAMAEQGGLALMVEDCPALISLTVES